MVAGVVVGLVALIGLGVGLTFLIGSGSAVNQVAHLQKEDISSLSSDALVDRQCQLIEMLLGEMEKIHTPEDLNNSRKALQGIAAELQRVENRIQIRAINEKSMDALGRAMIRLGQRLLPLRARFDAVQARFQNNPHLLEAISRIGFSPTHTGIVPSRSQSRAHSQPDKMRNEIDEYENGGRQQLYLECVQALRTLAFQAEAIRVPFQLRDFVDEFGKYKKQLDQVKDRTRENNLRFIGLSFAERNEYDAECQRLVTRIQSLISSMLVKEEFRQAMAERVGEYSDFKLDGSIYGQFVVNIPQVAGTRQRNRGRGPNE